MSQDKSKPMNPQSPHLNSTPGATGKRPEQRTTDNRTGWGSNANLGRTGGSTTQIPNAGLGNKDKSKDTRGKGSF